METNDMDKFDLEKNGYQLNYQNAGFQTDTSIPDLSWNAVPGSSVPNLGYYQNPFCQFPKLGSFLPPSLSDIPVDSGFIERAAQFSRFNGANVSAMLGSINNSAFDHSKRTENLAEGGINRRGMERNETGGGASSKGCGQGEGTSVANAKKRKRPNQGNEVNQGEEAQQSPVAKCTKEITEKEKRKEKKHSDNQRNDGSDAANKEEYVHVRARCGQATNSHSLAERVRREKNSARMKYLQDLVPSCSKVTGKAVMLDEIINYVQSLQRQVEFLSMKFAAINPQLDFNIESILSKSKLFNPHVGTSSSMSYVPDPGQTQLHHSQQNFLDAGMTGIVDPADVLRRIANAQLTSNSGLKEPLPQMSNAWDGDYQNLQVGYQDLNN